MEVWAVQVVCLLPAIVRSRIRKFHAYSMILDVRSSLHSAVQPFNTQSPPDLTSGTVWWPATLDTAQLKHGTSRSMSLDNTPSLRDTWTAEQDLWWVAKSHDLCNRTPVSWSCDLVMCVAINILRIHGQKRPDMTSQVTCPFRVQCGRIGGDSKPCHK